MPMKLPRRQSKRVTLSDKHKVEKKLREHKRKQAKIYKAKKAAGQLQWKTKNPIQRIPADFPDKQKILAELEAKRQRDKQWKLTLREKRRARELEQTNDPESADGPSNTQGRSIGGKVVKAAEHSAVIMSVDIDSLKKNAGLISVSTLHQQRQSEHWAEIRKAVQQAHLVVHVLDARDPLGSRSRSVEHLIERAAAQREVHVPLIYVLTKCDLVPVKVLQQWVTYFQLHYSQHPLLCMYAAQQAAFDTKTGVPIDDLPQLDSITALRQLLSNYQAEDSRLYIAFTGYGNVGKSSLINTLLESGSTGVGANPYFTKSNTHVKFTSPASATSSTTTILIDTPSIPPTPTQPGPHTILPTDQPIPTLYNILQSFTPMTIQRCLRVSRFVGEEVDLNDSSYELTESDYQQLLANAAKEVYHTLTRDHQINEYATAREILKKWNLNEIAYLSVPPASDESGSETSQAATSTRDDSADLAAMFEQANAATLQQLTVAARRQAGSGLQSLRPLDSFLALQGSLFAPLPDADADAEAEQQQDEQEDLDEEMNVEADGSLDEGDEEEEDVPTLTSGNPLAAASAEAYDFKTDFV